MWIDSLHVFPPAWRGWSTGCWILLEDTGFHARISAGIIVSPTELCVTWVCSDSLYSGLGKWQESLLYLALIKIAPAVQVLDTKIWSGQHSQGSCGIEFKTQFQLWHACWKSCSSLASSLLPSGHTLFFISSLICLFQLVRMLTFCVCITLHSPPFFR